MQESVVLHEDAPAIPMLASDVQLLLEGLEKYANHHKERAVSSYQIAESPTTPNAVGEEYRSVGEAHEEVYFALTGLANALNMALEPASSEETVGFVHVPVSAIYADIELVRDALSAFDQEIRTRNGDDVPKRDDDALYDVLFDIAHYATDRNLEWDALV